LSLQNQIGTILFRALRPYQIDALAKINDYINSDSSKHALIKMPMGTGKSIVIAVVSTLLTNVESSIIVTSSTAVKDQLIKDISENVWEKMGVTDWPHKRVVEVLPSTFSDVSDSPTIFVSTIQALLLLKKISRIDLNFF
jgi:superfamily II DNA or RNA helicase